MLPDAGVCGRRHVGCSPAAGKPCRDRCQM